MRPQACETFSYRIGKIQSFAVSAERYRKGAFFFLAVQPFVKIKAVYGRFNECQVVIDPDFSRLRDSDRIFQHVQHPLQTTAYLRSDYRRLHTAPLSLWAECLLIPAYHHT